MNGVVLFVAALVFVVACWLVMYGFYRRIWRARVKWWAIPFCHGAILFARRLPDRWERR